MKIERQLQGTLNTVFTELIKEKKLDKKILAYPALEENRADITLKRASGKPIFFIELKDPTASDGKSVFDSNVLMREMERAQKNNVKYFGNCNFLACAFMEANKMYDKSSVNEGFFTIQDIARLSANYAPNKEIERKLRAIAEFYLDRALEIVDDKTINFSPPDELFIFKIRKLIEAYAHPITDKVWSKYRKDKSFAKKVAGYAQSQLWNRPSTYQEIEKLSHIALLMLISKLIFYKAYVDNRTWHKLSPMQVGDDVETPEHLEELIWEYFEEFKEITRDFELLIGERSDIIFQMPFVSEAVIDLVKDVLDAGGLYNFSKIAYDVVGRIFEELIREDERHKLGQYFTPPHVIDLINAYCIHYEKDKIFDPSCGSGTFLVRAYERKKDLSKTKGGATKRHNVLLNEIYGNDLSGYPAYLSMLNLAIRNTKRASYPLIINKDFFSIVVNSKVELHNQQGELVRKMLPKFDAIIGNPPYTRQEDIGTMKGTVDKGKIQLMVKKECDVKPSKRTSIYGYFFYHAAIFLKEGGYLGYICQNSWMETNYGIDMQRYFLNNFEIIAIMDSEVERFFPTASVNTTIVILRKRQKDEDKRDENIVRFVYFKEPLQEIIRKHRSADKLQHFIEKINENTDCGQFQVNCIKQEELKQHTKWTQFLKAPKVYFNILKKGGELFKPLAGKNGLAEVKYGIKTGNNSFFLVKDVTDVKGTKLQAAVNGKEYINSIKVLKQNKLRLVENGKKELWLIEDCFLEPVLKSPKYVVKYEVSSSKVRYRLLKVDEGRSVLRDNYPFLFAYIKHGESNGVNTGSTVLSRQIWYDVGEHKLPDMSFSYMINDFGKTYYGKVYTNDNFQNIYTKKGKLSVFLYMNSTVSWLFQQIIMRTNFGDGVAKIQSYELAEMLVADVDLEKLNINLGETKNFKEELGDLKSLKTVNE